MPPVAHIFLVGLVGILIVKTSAVRTATQTNTDRACFHRLGCFELGEPWSRGNSVPQPSEPDEDTVVLYFYSRLNTEEPEIFLTYPDVDIYDVPFDGSRPTVVIIHDHHQNATMEWIHTMKYFYLLDLNSNVLMVDYTKACSASYAQTVSNARVVGQLISRLLKYLVTNRSLQPEQIHLIGHGLGAHIASYIAKDITGIFRLTALDPLRPLFEDYDRRIRLDKTDASFVEIVHSNAIPSEGYGMLNPHGHVDFYINDGANQPGCLFPPGFPTITTIWDVFGLITQYTTLRKLCNHDRAYDYLVEAYNSLSDCIIWGHRVTTPPTADSLIRIIVRYIQSFFPFFRRSPKNLPDCTEDDCIVFGYEAIESSLTGVFVVKTNQKPPYCIHEAGLPLP